MKAQTQPLASTTIDRAIGAYLGLAVGDAYGRPLEFVHLPQVRTMPVSTAPGIWMWTDDTHMSLYLGHAILRLDAGPLHDDAFGHAVGHQFVRWSHDPLTPSTAPGGTCLQGAASYEAHGDWRTSGVPTSDGCGAVMRICPLALAFEGEELTRAARISAVVTHGHKNAIEAAIAAAQLLRWTLETGHFTEALVLQAIQRLQDDWSLGGDVAAALSAALRFANQPTPPQWLDEPSIPTGDGGWRSASALGLAVAATLTWGSDVEQVIDKAARIDGDSDSVACLAGMFWGAAHGAAALPASWLASLPDRDQIIDQAKALAQRGFAKAAPVDGASGA